MAKILVVEGDSFLAKFYTVKLRDLKHEVEIVYSGEEAHQKLKMQAYDAIVMDIILPYRDGFTLLQDLKKMRRRMKAKVIVSEIQQKESIEKAKDLGADYFFIKNETQVFEIIETVDALVKGKRVAANNGIKLSTSKASTGKPHKKKSNKKTPKKKK